MHSESRVDAREGRCRRALDVVVEAEVVVSVPGEMQKKRETE